MTRSPYLLRFSRLWFSRLWFSRLRLSRLRLDAVRLDACEPRHNPNVGFAMHCMRLAITTMALATCLVLSACSNSIDETAKASLQRIGPLGSLRDFVLYRSDLEPANEALLVDRFEVTQDDWNEFAATDQGKAATAARLRSLRNAGNQGNGSLPAALMDLYQARAFARWRHARLPTEDEWRRVTSGGGSNPFPWGAKEIATHANTGELGLGEATPVGTFEMGRRAGGNSPYDLIGNVSEWTETVPSEWCRDIGLEIGASFSVSRQLALATPALSTWGQLGILAPAMIAAAAGPDAPHKVVGADYASPMQDVRLQKEDTQLAGDRRMRTGMRVYTTVGELVESLLSIRALATADETSQLTRFANREDIGEVLLEAFLSSPVATAEFTTGSVADVFASQLRKRSSKKK